MALVNQFRDPATVERLKGERDRLWTRAKRMEAQAKQMATGPIGNMREASEFAEQARSAMGAFRHAEDAFVNYLSETSDLHAQYPAQTAADALQARRDAPGKVAREQRLRAERDEKLKMYPSLRDPRPREEGGDGPEIFPDQVKS